MRRQIVQVQNKEQMESLTILFSCKYLGNKRKEKCCKDMACLDLEGLLKIIYQRLVQGVGRSQPRNQQLFTSVIFSAQRGVYKSFLLATMPT